jgi:hypothetical protein
MSENGLDVVANAVLAGAIRALRLRAAAQTEKAKFGTTTAEKNPEVLIRTGESAIAVRIAAALTDCADDLEGGLA